MLTFHKWLIGDLGTPGEYMYRSIHWASVITVGLVLAAVIVYCIANHKHPHRCRSLLHAVCWFQLAFEFLWRVVYLFVKGASPADLWPMYPCNLGGILIPIMALTGYRRGKQLFYLFGFVGGVLTFAMPDGIFTSDVLSFPILKSILQHTGLLLIPAIELLSDGYRPTLRDLGWVITGCFIHLFNCEVIDRLLGFTGDYMFLRSGLPFVIPGVPQFITMGVFAILVFALLSFLCDIPGSLAFLKSRKKQPI